MKGRSSWPRKLTPFHRSNCKNTFATATTRSISPTFVPSPKGIARRGGAGGDRPPARRPLRLARRRAKGVRRNTLSGGLYATSRTTRRRYPFGRCGHHAESPRGASFALKRLAELPERPRRCRHRQRIAGRHGRGRRRAICRGRSGVPRKKPGGGGSQPGSQAARPQVHRLLRRRHVVDARPPWPRRPTSWTPIRGWD